MKFEENQRVSFAFQPKINNYHKPKKKKKKKNPPLEKKRKKKYLTRYEISGVVWWMAQQARWSGLVVNMVRLVWCCGHVVRLVWLRERARENQIGERERERERDVLRRREKKCKQNRNKILAFVVRTVLMNSTVLKIELYGQKC